MKLGRNDACWCGSGRKYKACHMAFDEKLEQYKAKGVLVPPHKLIKTPEQIEGIRKAGEINTMVLDEVAKHVKEGVTTAELDKVVHDYTLEIGGIPACLGYEGYPKSVCISINEVVCHGIPDEVHVLKDGDIVNIDCTTIYNGYYGDASRMFMIGNVSEKRKKLVEVTKECLEIGLKEAQPYTRLGDVGYVIDEHVRANGYSVVREIGGHGVGLEMHEEPYVAHFGVRDTGMLLVPGMVFTIEPMVNMGTNQVFVDAEDEWTVYTEDGLPSAQWEYTILVTENGNEVLSR